jgi:hypothetical protein
LASVPASPLAERMFHLAGVQDTRLDDPEAAEQSLRRILEFDPTNETALKRLSTMFARRGRNTDYILSLEQALEAAAISSSLRSCADRRCTTSSRAARRGGERARAPLELEPDLETFGVLVATPAAEELGGGEQPHSAYAISPDLSIEPGSVSGAGLRARPPRQRAPIEAG